jgi:hypothetical protein
MIIMKSLLFAFLSALALCSCSSELATGSGAGRFAQAPNDRPGLGTKWGETRQSYVVSSDFQRADPEHPFTTAAIYYNDEIGIRATMSNVSWQRAWPILPSPMQRLIAVGLKDPIGFFYPGLFIGNRWFVVGKEGRRYSIFLENKSDLRLEVVLSVDGLDAVDGRKASLRKRGYILRPHERLKVEGFRQSSEAVAAFRFSSVRESYAAEKYHHTGDVGVIGIAIFNERGSNVPTSGEVQKRLQANPFPGSFATPP